MAEKRPPKKTALLPKKFLGRRIALLVLSLALGLVLLPQGQARMSLGGREPKASIRINAIGDIILHIPIKQAARQLGSYKPYFQSIAPLLQDAELNFANLETTIQGKQEGFFAEGWPGFFSAPVSLVKDLQETGFNIINIANNHALDYGNPGLRRTYQAVSTLSGVKTVGVQERPSRSPALQMVVNNVKVAFIGYTVPLNLLHHVPRRYPRLNYLEDFAAIEKMTHNLTELRRHNDLVIVSVHWGKEYQDEQKDASHYLARKMVAAGADVILGHHPHVPRKVALVSAAQTKKGPLRRGIVFYSMGNFLANQGRGLRKKQDYLTRSSALFQLQVDFYQAGDKLVKSYDWHYIPVWIKNSWMMIGREPYKVPIIKPTLLQCEKKRVLRRLKRQWTLQREGKNANIKRLYLLMRHYRKINKGLALLHKRLKASNMRKVSCAD